MSNKKHLRKAIYSIIKHNDTTIKTLKEFCYSFGFQKGIKDYLPVVSIGKQNGHTSAASKFIEKNPNLRFGIVTPSTMFEQRYQQFNNTVKLFIYDATNVPTIEVGTYDYIILDDVITNTTDVIFNGFMSELLRTSTTKFDNTRIIVIGN